MSREQPARHFLVERDRRGLRSVRVFDAVEDALVELAERERALGQHQEVVLLGADSLATLLRTHGVWFDVGSARRVRV